ncbi:flavin-containing monooxygenase [Flavitalea flava]
MDFCGMNTHTIIIGAGQSGLATGYHLQRLKIDFLIIDAAAAIGDAWANRWDSLRLFTPYWANDLPGLPFSGNQDLCPTKDEMAAYLKKYVAHFDLPVRLQTKVRDLVKKEDGYLITLSDGKTLSCRNVVVATGNYSIPKIPAFARELDPRIVQLHSSVYKKPSGLPEGAVLVVGAGTSGLQIALDLVRSRRRTYVAGKPPARIPDFALRYAGRLFIWMMRNILTIHTPMGRKVRNAIKVQGAAAPLINISPQTVYEAGVVPLPKIEGVRNGCPLLPDGHTLEVSGIIWCTGYNRDFSWIRLPGVTDETGYPLTYRGISQGHKGLYFTGMAFQYSLASAQIGGVGKDAAYIARHINKTMAKNGERFV